MHRVTEHSHREGRPTRPEGRRFSTILLTSLLIAGACGESAPFDPGVGGDGRPWEQQFTFGNFSINTGEIATRQDGVSPAYVSDYVPELELPSSDYEVFTVHAYLPYSATVEPVLATVGVRVGTTDGGRTADIYRSSEFVERYAGFAVFRLTGLTVAAPPITRDRFAHVVFEMSVEYREDGDVATKVERTIEIYKR